MQTREPHWSPDGFWWWDGERWVAAAQAPMPPPPGVPPGYFAMPAPVELKPSPGLRPFLIVVLVIDALFFGLLTLAGIAGENADFAEGKGDTGGVIFLAVIVVIFVLAVLALVGVLWRTVWARWVALAAGIVVSLTCLGSVIGIPIIVAAARAPLGKKPAT